MPYLNLRRGLPYVVIWTAICCPPVFAQDRAQVEAGEMIYDQHCASCHGEKVRGTGAMPDLRDLSSDNRQVFDKTVMEGKGQMPALQGILTNQELDQLWSYIRSRARG